MLKLSQKTEKVRENTIPVVFSSEAVLHVSRGGDQYGYHDMGSAHGHLDSAPHLPKRARVDRPDLSQPLRIDIREPEIKRVSSSVHLKSFGKFIFFWC